MRLLIIGCGNVARELAAVLADRDRFEGLRHLDARLIGICTRSHGTLVNSDGIDWASIMSPGAERPWAADHPDRAELESSVAVGTLDYDVLVELSILSIQERGEPALGYVKEALQRDRHVVTANKGPLAFGGARLLETARHSAGRLLFESTVMDGTPLFSLAREGLRGCRVQALEGVLNATSNLVLDALAQGGRLEDALDDARARGIAEADATHDLEGWDSAAKLAVLANTLMGGDMTPLDVERRGVTELTRADFDSSAVWRLVCRARIEDDRVTASVRPRRLTPDHPLARCRGADCQLTIETDLLAPFSIRQYEAGLRDTAYGVVNDLMMALSF